MIYTVTFNPALDYVVHVDDLRPGQLNRTVREELQVGGKGINVSLILKELGVDSVALGFLAGRTGTMLEQWLASMAVPTDFIHLPEGMTRINVKLKGEQETEINGQGPHIPPEAIEELFRRLNALQNGDTLVLAGSIPSSLPCHVYERILTHLAGRSVSMVVDASGKLLERVLPYRPFLIKPNQHELGELCGVEIDPRNAGQIIRCARQLQGQGARNVLVSLAGSGALLMAESGEVFSHPAACGTVKNSVGSGDAMLAGFLAGYAQGGYKQALRLGTAAGGATAFSPRLATRAEIDEVYRQFDT